MQSKICFTRRTLVRKETKMKKLVLFLALAALFSTIAFAKSNVIKIDTAGYAGDVILTIPADVCVPSLNVKDKGYVSYTYKKKGKVTSMQIAGDKVIFSVVGRGILYVKINAYKSGVIKIQQGAATKSARVGGN
jgi:hypothetical protein